MDSISHKESKRDGIGERDMPTIVHFEIPSDDIERSKRFYDRFFGWKIREMTTGQYSKRNGVLDGYQLWMINGIRTLTGGMMKRQMLGQQGITTYIDVKLVREYSAKVEQLGGMVISAIMPVPGMGYFAMCADTENNAVTIWETDNTATLNNWALLHLISGLITPTK